MNKLMKSTLVALFGIGLVVIIGLSVSHWRLNKQLNELKAQQGLTYDFPFDSRLFSSADALDTWTGAGNFSKELSGLQQRIDAMFKQMASDGPQLSMQDFGQFADGPTVDMQEDAKQYTITVQLPKGQNMALATQLEEGYLTITGEVESEEKQNRDRGAALLTQRSEFRQTLSLAQPVDKAGMQTQRKGEQFIITVPKA